LSISPSCGTSSALSYSGEDCDQRFQRGRRTPVQNASPICLLGSRCSATTWRQIFSAPSIHVPDAEEIFRVTPDDCDYQAKTSDKGRYEAVGVQKFGDLEKAGYALWSDKHRILLQKYLDNSDSQEGVVDQGVRLKDSRLYLDFQSTHKILGSDNSPIRSSMNMLSAVSSTGLYFSLRELLGCRMAFNR